MNKNREQNRKINEEILKEFDPEFERKVFTKIAISVKIEEARLRKHWTKVELAKRFKKKPSVITKWLSGSHNFTIDTLVEIEDLLHIKVLSIAESQEKVDVQQEKVDIQYTSPSDYFCLDVEKVIQYYKALMIENNPTFTQFNPREKLYRA